MQATTPTSTPDILPFTSRARLRHLAPEERERLKQGTLRILEEIGVRIPSKKALSLFADHGARVDKDTQIVRIPSDLVQKAMSTAPRSFVLAGREKRLDLLLDGTRSYLCTEGCGVHVIDPDTRRMRASCKADVARSARIADALPLVGFYWPMVTAQDCGTTAPLHDCHAALHNTLKHVRGGTTVPPFLAKYIVETAVVAAGDRERLRRRPPINANICTISPLGHDANGLEAALMYAEAGIPVSFMAMPTMGSTAPASVYGAMLVGDAEVISGMVMIQLAFPGAPVFHSVLVSMMDPRTGGYIAEHTQPVKLLATELGHAWHVPSLGGGGVATDAVENGWQSGVEGGLGSLFIGLSGAEICGHLGLTAGAMILSPEKMIMDHELCLMAYELMNGVDFDAAGMALDVIRDVGPGGHFLMERHTVEHVRDFRISKLLHRRDEADAPLEPRQLAREVYQQIDQGHFPAPPPPAVVREMGRILSAADQEAEKRR